MIPRTRITVRIDTLVFMRLQDEAAARGIGLGRMLDIALERSAPAPQQPHLPAPAAPAPAKPQQQQQPPTRDPDGLSDRDRRDLAADRAIQRETLARLAAARLRPKQTQHERDAEFLAHAQALSERVKANPE